MLFSFKKWWYATTRSEKSALLTLAGIFTVIMLFNAGAIIGAAVYS